MIKFFRKIRQNLLMENKTGKYFKYAIGEIILVVIGILIALWINSTYNDYKEKKVVNKKLISDYNNSGSLFFTNSKSKSFNIISGGNFYTPYGKVFKQGMIKT